MTEEHLLALLDRAEVDLQQAYAELGTPRAGDEELLARLVARAADAFTPPLGSGPAVAGRPFKPWLVGALVVGTAGVAASLPHIWGPSEDARHVVAVDQTEEGERLDSGSATAPDAPLKSRQVAAPTGPESVRSDSMTPEPASVPSGPVASSSVVGARRRKRPAPTTIAAEKPTAAELLIAANQSRRAGELEQARDGYGLLVRDYADTREAAVARFNLGVLAWQRPDAAAAVRHFDAYLDHSPRGNLAEDAMYYRARALQDLDKRAAEGVAWKRLLDRFPDSAYQGRARLRLDVLADP